VLLLSTLPAVHETAEARRLEWDTPLDAQAATQFEHALAPADVPDFVANRLRHPERALRDAGPVAAIREVSAALEARGIYP
jgi:hypothetical protein